MDSKIRVLHSNKTWTLVPLNSSMNILTCRWVFRQKFNEAVKVEHFKSSISCKWDVLGQWCWCHRNLCSDHQTNVHQAHPQFCCNVGLGVVAIRRLKRLSPWSDERRSLHETTSGVERWKTTHSCLQVATINLWPLSVTKGVVPPSSWFHYIIWFRWASIWSITIHLLEKRR